MCNQLYDLVFLIIGMHQSVMVYKYKSSFSDNALATALCASHKRLRYTLQCVYCVITGLLVYSAV
jgi:hypothetical protein